MKNQFPETRGGCIERHVSAYLRESGASEQSWAGEVVRIYHERTPASLRGHRFHEGGDAYRDLVANTQILHRMLWGDYRLSSEIEEACVLALPPARERKAWVELSARVGRMSIAQPESGAAGLYADCANLLGDAGTVLRAYRPLLEDGRVSEADSPAALKLALESLRELASTVHTLIHDVADTLDKQGNHHMLQNGLREVANG